MATNQPPTKTPGQIELERIAAEEAAGRDPFGDFDDEEDPAAAAAAAAADNDAPGDDGADGDGADEEGADEEGEGEGDDPPAAAAAAPAAPPAAAPAPTPQAAADDFGGDEPPPYRGEPLDAIKAQRAELLAKQRAALREALDGDKTPAELEAIQAETQAKLDDLLVKQSRAEARVEAVQEYQTGVINGLMDLGAKQGIDYKTDTAAAAQFDAALSALLATENGKPFKTLATTAHNIVLGMRGVAKAAAPAPAPRPAGNRQAPPAPPTLRGAPPAAAPAVGNTVSQALANVTGQKFMDAYRRMSPAEKARLLDED